MQCVCRVWEEGQDLRGKEGRVGFRRSKKVLQGAASGGTARAATVLQGGGDGSWCCRGRELWDGRGRGVAAQKGSRSEGEERRGKKRKGRKKRGREGVVHRCKEEEKKEEEEGA